MVESTAMGGSVASANGGQASVSESGEVVKFEADDGSGTFHRYDTLHAYALVAGEL